MRMESAGKRIVRLLEFMMILIVSWLIGTLLLFAVYVLPTEPMKENVARGTQVYNNEGNFPELAAGYRSTKLDNDTDATMLSNAVYPVSNAVQDAMNVPMIGYEECGDRLHSLLHYVNDVKGETYVTTYPRYWHGYLVVLKPLLLFFDFSDLRVFNMFFQFLLVAYAISLWSQGFRKHYFLAFLALIVTWNPVTVALSFQNSTCFYISIIALIYMIKHGKYLNESIYRMGIFFFVVGIITVYFDFLTYPLVTLGIPLAYWLMAREEWRKENGARQPKENIGKTLGRIIACSAFWSAGYLGMWVGKWTIASFLLKQNIFLDAFRQILLHTSDSADYTKWDCIWLQMEVLARWPYLIIFGGMLIGIFIINRRKIKDAIVHMNCTFLSILPYLFVATYPFVWYLVASGHCYANPKFTFRILGITVFAGFLGILSCFRQENADRE